MKETTKVSLPYSAKLDVLTPEEQDKIIIASYCHQYGVLFRIALFAGLSMYELLGLQWSDVDFEEKQIKVQYEFCYGEESDQLIPKSTPRSVTLPSSVFQELADLHENQLDTLVEYQLTSHSNAVAATLKGYQMPPWLVDFFFSQLLQFCKLPDYSFSILRDTFALRSIENGTGPDILSQMLDDPNVERTYAYFYSMIKKTWY